jgi:hypothetical protein
MAPWSVPRFSVGQRVARSLPESSPAGGTGSVNPYKANGTRTNGNLLLLKLPPQAIGRALEHSILKRGISGGIEGACASIHLPEIAGEETKKAPVFQPPGPSQYSRGDHITSTDAPQRSNPFTRQTIAEGGQMALASRATISCHSPLRCAPQERRPSSSAIRPFIVTRKAAPSPSTKPRLRRRRRRFGLGSFHRPSRVRSSNEARSPAIRFF